MKISSHVFSEKNCSLTWIFILPLLFFSCSDVKRQSGQPDLEYEVSMEDPGNGSFHVVLECSIPESDTVLFKMPEWMPGYYQIMDYSDKVTSFKAAGRSGRSLDAVMKDDHTWMVVPGRDRKFTVSYDVLSDRRFVACNYLDTAHAYIIPAATFIYPDGYINAPLRVRVRPYNGWDDIATGLKPVEGAENEFTAPGFDILYDCPILTGDLDELTPFTVNGITHRFITWNAGEFDGELLISNLKTIVEASARLMGEIPYSEYTFIGIGPGQGGIEHLNNTTISFTGRGLDRPEGMNRILMFIAHEYFHNYNVKRIRPFELGPFDYDKGNRTNLLWFSEGATVYYEYLLVRRAGLISDEDLLANIENNINSTENDPGLMHQSLIQASYNTWSDGPFGNAAGGPDRSISYYDKGPVVSMILDFAIRNATGNARSLDDVMRFLYNRYCKEFRRGFTDAEFQNACENIAGTSLSPEFEYVFTTREIDYPKYLSYAGLKISESEDRQTGKKQFRLSKSDSMNPEQSAIFRSWSGN
jgi:predicted metalloprotease with PDZ domain